MIYNLHFDDGDVIEFDSIKFTINRDVEFKPRPYQHFYYENKVEKSENKIDIKCAKIQLGFVCNYKCKYCHYLPYHEPKISNQDLERAKKTIRVLFEKFNITQSIEFWGGEPLVYWKLLKVLIEEIRKISKDTPLAMISNGSLLTKEKAEFFVKHNVDYYMSHDGPGQSLRNEKDVLDDEKVIEAMKVFWEKSDTNRFDNFKFHFTITPKAPNVIETIRYLQSKTHEKVFITTEGLVDKFVHNKNVATFSYEEQAILIESILQAYACDDECFSAFHTQIDDFSKNIASKKFEKRTLETFPKYMCADTALDTLTITCNGDISHCHAEKNIPSYNLGNICDDDFDLSAKLKYFTKMREDCRDCICASMCIGGCPRLNDDNHKEYCENRFLIGVSTLSAIMYRFFNKRLVRIEKKE